MPPNIPEKGDEQGNSKNGEAFLEKNLNCWVLGSQEVDGTFDHQGNQKLEEIHQKQTQEPDGKGPAVLEKILFQGMKILESFGKRQGESFHGKRNTGIDQEMSIFWPF